MRAIAAAWLAALVLAGCASLESRPTLVRAVVVSATVKVIQAGPDQAERAAYVADLADRLAERFTAGEIATIPALESLARGRVPWADLSAEDAILADALIVTIRNELVERYGTEGIPAPQRPEIATVLRWASEGAALSAARQ